MKRKTETIEQQRNPLFTLDTYRVLLILIILIFRNFWGIDIRAFAPAANGENNRIAVAALLSNTISDTSSIQVLDSSSSPGETESEIVLLRVQEAD
jgi:hypothetical protein